MKQLALILASVILFTGCFLVPQTNLTNKADGAELSYVTGADLVTEVQLVTGGKAADDLVVVVGGKGLAVTVNPNYGTCEVSKQASFVTCKASSVPREVLWKTFVSGTVQTTNASFYRPGSQSVVFLRFTK